jgi:hypothetical protein
MLEVSALMDVITMVLLAAGAYALFLLRTGTEAAVKTSAEEAARATIQQLKWPAELARELQKTRGVERQELRFKSYGGLWKELRPLAIYDRTLINRRMVGELSSKLSDWYFSEAGGLLLTPQARNFYFALQDMLRATSSTPEEWKADRSGQSEGAHRDTFRAILVARTAGGGSNPAVLAFDYFGKGEFDDWLVAAVDHGRNWRDGIGRVATIWRELNDPERFAVLQQVGSILRTSLANDLESRSQ